MYLWKTCILENVFWCCGCVLYHIFLYVFTKSSVVSVYMNIFKSVFWEKIENSKTSKMVLRRLRIQACLFFIALLVLKPSAIDWKCKKKNDSQEERSVRIQRGGSMLTDFYFGTHVIFETLELYMYIYIHIYICIYIYIERERDKSYINIYIYTYLFISYSIGRWYKYWPRIGSPPCPSPASAKVSCQGGNKFKKRTHVR